MLNDFSQHLCYPFLNKSYAVGKYNTALGLCLITFQKISANIPKTLLFSGEGWRHALSIRQQAGVLVDADVKGGGRNTVTHGQAAGACNTENQPVGHFAMCEQIVEYPCI